MSNPNVAIAARWDSNGAGALNVLPLKCDAAGRLLLGAGVAVATLTFDSGSAAAYSAGDAVGAVVSVDLSAFVETSAGLMAAPTGVGSVVLETVLLVEQVSQAAPMTLLLFSLDPTAIGSPATVTDNAAFAWGTGTAYLNLVGKVDITAGDYATVDAKSVAALGDLGMAMQPSALANDGKIYAVLVTQGTPTYGASKRVVVRLGFRKL